MYFCTCERHYEQFSQYSALKVTVVLYIITIGSAERVKPRSDRTDRTFVCFLTHDCSWKLWKQYQRKPSVV